MIVVKGVCVALSAISFGSGTYAPREGRVGMAYLFTPGQYDRVLADLRDVQADLQLLSMHYRTENSTGLNSRQVTMFRRAVDEAGVHEVPRRPPPRGGHR